MDDPTAQIVGAIIAIAIIVGLIKGAIKTFQRNWIAALLLLIFLFPIWVLWAIGELFTGEISKSTLQPSPQNQNVNVTLVNHPDAGGVSAKQLTNSTPEQTTQLRDITEPPLTDRGTPLPVSADVKECPFCAETIKSNAVVCRFCNRDL